MDSNPLLWTIHKGDALEVLRAWPDGFVQCVVTSPPYWKLRDYGEEGQGGLEETPEEHVEWIVAVMREVRRVLRDDGTVWLNYGDSYAGGGNGGGGSFAKDGIRAALPGTDKNKAFRHGPRGAVLGLKPKDLVMMPTRVALALQADGWWIRQEIIWSKPNPMPESANDRPTTSHEKLFLLSKRARYFYDADAVREEGAGTATTKAPDGWDTGEGSHGTIHRNGREKGRKTDKQRGHSRRHAGFNDRRDGMTKEEQGANGRNLRSVWSIPTQPYAGAHFATFPERLVEPCIKAGTSEKGACAVCGTPWERIVEKSGAPHDHRGNTDYEKGGNGQRLASARDSLRSRGNGHDNPFNPGKTLGWKPACLCGSETGTRPLPCVVLDPFAGSGTVGVVAGKLGRAFIGIDLAGGDKDMGGHTANQRIEAARRKLTAPLADLPVALDQTELFEEGAE